MPVSVQSNPCPFAQRAAVFDAFEGEYQLDPAEALRWSRDQLPVFFAPKLGYWVVSRYDDVKAVFRDNVTYSPSVALEKMCPFPPEAEAVLKRYNYGMHRTLVNEDEPAHMERRRALLTSFTPEALLQHAPMVRRLTRAYMDRFIDAGRVDLVQAMLWEIPLTVALHFLGVPEDDMDTLRAYSVAHTVNTWGRPSPDEQLSVAEAVGKFWQYAGQVLERMREAPHEPGWMRYAIRQQAVLPEVVTDSFLHSMMMAIIVAAHETTAHAIANALKVLLERPAVWRAICAQPELIPNAVEECLRFAGSVVAWRRITTCPTSLGGVDLPAQARLLIVSASANHDERHFENPDEIDLYRENTADHLTFGYGSHQCLGKNLARMELRIFLEEFTRRLPHMALEPQDFNYLPNTSFRGPEQLWVRWDPAHNPERCAPDSIAAQLPVTIGPPDRRQLARELVVIARQRLSDRVIEVTLGLPAGGVLPAWTAGSHIDLLCSAQWRSYSLCGNPAERDCWRIAVLRETQSRSGSVWLHEQALPGTVLRVRGPRNHFRLDESMCDYLLIAGGIGITPILAMADRLRALGKRYHLCYLGRSRRELAYLERLQREHGAALSMHISDEGSRCDLPALLGEYASVDAVYACGPERLLDALTDLMKDSSARLHVEYFSAHDAAAPQPDDRPFSIELADSGLSFEVPVGVTVLQTLRAAGIDVASDCEEGLCGSCQVEVRAGDIDHRDRVLTEAERASGRAMLSCCSRARGERLVLGL